MNRIRTAEFTSPYGEIEVYSKRKLNTEVQLMEALGPLVLSLGFFDGVHLGHQSLLNETMEASKKIFASSAVLTFVNHPLTEVFPRYAPKLLMNNRQKAEKILRIGVDYVIFLPFTNAVRKLSPKDFVKKILLGLFDLKGVVCGFNYSFGFKGKGSAETLLSFGAEYGFFVRIMDAFHLEDVSVSSTAIRELLGTGDVKTAASLLGEPYRLEGVVQTGKKLGRKYKIPTANMSLDLKKILPKSGVYFTKLTVDGKSYDGLTNLGYNPTFEKHPYAVETYIYDFDEDIYGKAITLDFLERIRGDIKFDNLEALFEQIHSDIRKVNLLFRHSESKE